MVSLARVQRGLVSAEGRKGERLGRGDERDEKQEEEEDAEEVKIREWSEVFVPPHFKHPLTCYCVVEVVEEAWWW